MLDDPGSANPGNPIDMHIGNRVRLRRRFLGISRQSLADRLGISFQQLHEYEQGTSRVSAGRLYQIAGALDTPVSFYFPASGPPAGSEQETRVDELFAVGSPSTADALDLVRVFTRITEPKLRRRVVDLVRAIVPHD